jgi:putative transposase
MKDFQSLSHTTWDCKYHLVWIPKWWRKVLYGQLRKHLGEVFKALALHREAKVLEGHLMGDHVHMLLSIPPKYSVSQVVGYVKGKSAIHIARTYTGHRRNFAGSEFLGQGLLRINGRSRRGDHPQVHPEARRDGPRNRPTKPVLGVATFRWLMVLLPL